MGRFWLRLSAKSREENTTYMGFRLNIYNSSSVYLNKCRLNESDLSIISMTKQDHDGRRQQKRDGEIQKWRGREMIKESERVRRRERERKKEG